MRRIILQGALLGALLSAFRPIPARW